LTVVVAAFLALCEIARCAGPPGIAKACSVVANTAAVAVCSAALFCTSRPDPAVDARASEGGGVADTLARGRASPRTLSDGAALAGPIHIALTALIRAVTVLIGLTAQFRAELILAALA